MENGEIRFYSFKGNEENLIEFFENYEIENIFIPPDKVVKNLKKRPDRVCRTVDLMPLRPLLKKRLILSRI